MLIFLLQHRSLGRQSEPSAGSRLTLLLSGGETEALRMGRIGSRHTKTHWQLVLNHRETPMCLSQREISLSDTPVSQSGKLVLTVRSCSSARTRSSLGSSLRAGSEPEPGKLRAKEGDWQGKGHAHSMPVPCPPGVDSPAGGTRGGLAVLGRPEYPTPQHPPWSQVLP